MWMLWMYLVQQSVKLELDPLYPHTHTNPSPAHCSCFSCAVPVTSSRLQAVNWTLRTLLVSPE